MAEALHSLREELQWRSSAGMVRGPAGRVRRKQILLVLTGWGRHSPDNRPKLRPAVRAYLERMRSKGDTITSFSETQPGHFRVVL